MKDKLKQLESEKQNHLNQIDSSHFKVLDTINRIKLKNNEYQFDERYKGKDIEVFTKESSNKIQESFLMDKDYLLYKEDEEKIRYMLLITKPMEVELDVEFRFEGNWIENLEYESYSLHDEGLGSEEEDNDFDWLIELCYQLPSTIEHDLENVFDNKSDEELKEMISFSHDMEPGDTTVIGTYDMEYDMLYALIPVIKSN